MMPSAKIEKRSSAPPENKFTQPNSVLEAASKNEADACPSIPGVGIATPTRYTTSIAAVNSSRRRSSGMREAFENPSSIQCVSAFDQISAAAGRRDLLARIAGKSVGPNRQLDFQVAAAENLDFPTGAHQSTINQNRRIDGLALGETDQLAQVDLGEALARLFVFLQSAKAALRNPARERHLTAFVTHRRVTA